jgi:hypothetical protein
MKALVLVASIALALIATNAPAGAQERSDAPVVLALIVTNNHSAELGRPELQYADDDGAKYYELFRMVAAEADVELLTDFDRDSARLFPGAVAVAHEPTRTNVAAAAERLATRARQAASTGRPVAFYFVFAGHGDVDRGRGFLEARDGRITSGDLESMLKGFPATRAHVILDSCNSFFVLNPRRSGGRRLAVTEDAARSLSDRLPNVGVLLSTSAEAEVFEWSELQSGIFSHAVRSGLVGGADVDGDGRVTYGEIRAFIDVSTASVDNPLYRPKVFARGPNGHDDEPLFDLATARALRLELEGREQRVTVRDARELAWADLHKEAGATVTLRIPIERAAGSSVDERDPHSPTGVVVARRAVDAPDVATVLPLASLEARAPEARGPNELLGQLFATPFGPRAFADWREQAAREPEPVYGISAEDAERMRLLLFEVADMQRQWRHAGGAMMLAAGAVLATGGTWFLLDRKLPLTDPAVLGYTLVGEGGALALGGVATLAFWRNGEHLYDDYLHAMASPPVDGARVVADTEKRLFEMADTSRHIRHVLAPVGWSVAAITAGLFAVEEATDGNAQRRLELGTIDGIVGFCALTMATVSSVPSPIERMVELWSNDPAIQRLPRAFERPSVTILPVRGGGAALGLRGAF